MIDTEDRILKLLRRLLSLVSLIFVTILSVTPVIAQEAPLARIILPVRGQTIQGNIAITGNATAPQFARYQVLYAPEPDINNWVLINGGVQSIPNGALAVWNTRPVPDGKYAVKLQVFSTDGSAVESVVREITLANLNSKPTGGASAATLITSTLTPGGSNDLFINGSTNTPTLNLADLPRAFAKGVTYTGYAFGALIAYLVLKRLLGFLIRKMFHKPVDFGR